MTRRYKVMFKIVNFKVNTLLLGLCFSLPAFAESLQQICSEVQEEVQEGDLVFVEIDNKLFDNVAMTQGHWASHVGVAMKDKGEWVVAEATIPVSKMTPLCKFVKKGYKTRVGVKRINGGLSEDEVYGLHEAAKQRMGILYHTGFKLKSKRQFCSKFVDQLFNQALGLRVGRIQNFRNLLDTTEDKNVIKFWRWWFFGNIPWSRDTLTPGSQYQDSNFQEVYYFSSTD